VKITRIETIRNLRPIPLPEPWRPAWNEPDTEPVTSTGFSFYRVYTDEGIVGIGPCPGGAPHPAESALIGQDPIYIQKYWDAYMRGRGTAVGSTSGGGLEIALWDIVGKAAGMPVYKLLGACRDRVMAYAATAQLRPPEESAELALDFKERGIKAIKLRLHRPDPDDDLDVVRAVRSAVGSEMYIMVDANQNNPAPNYRYWSRRTALRVARELEKLDVYWLEEPLPRADVEGLAELRAAVDVYIAGAEHCPSIYEFRDALLAGAYDIVQPDVILGNIGIAGIRRISVLADAVGRLMVPHVCSGRNNGLYLAATLQALGTISNCPFVEYALHPPALTPATQHILLTEQITIDGDGYVEIPQKPGIGIEIDDEAVGEYL
jgi:L-alanine-DL-glutamate epimerase-like enolase superfamily enzyme